MAAVLALIPFGTQDIISNGLCHLVTKYTLTSKRKDKKLGTDISRQNHFINFVNKVMQLKDATLQSMHETLWPVIIAFYTEFCCVGNTLNKTLIRKATVDQYLDIAITYVKSKTTVDPSIDPTTKKRHSLIDSALNELKCWEKVPNGRMPITVPMIKCLIKYAKTKHEDLLENAIVDWFIMGTHTEY